MDLECSLQLEPHLQLLLGEEEPTHACTDVGDSLLPQPLPTPSLPPPLPPPLHATKWIEWHAEYVQTLSWWEELTQVPGHADHQEFTWKVCTSFDVPTACNQAKQVKNHSMPPLAYPYIGKHHFLLLRNVRFTSQDIHLSQLQHTVTYAMALQYWAEQIHTPSLANLVI